ncbi:MAG: TetR/AcrR family transcriptional regulator [Desulfatibacillaceae bacterium]
MPKIVDHDQYRDELLATCLDLFSEKGYSRVTMREIARASGISTGALYHYFPNKHGILEQVFLRAAQRDVEDAVERTSVSGSFEQRMELFIEFICDREGVFQKMLILAIDFLRNLESEDAERIVQEYVNYYVRNMQHYLELPEAVAQFIFVFFNGLFYQTRMLPGFISTRDMATIFKEMLMSFLNEHNDPRNRLCRMCPFMNDRPDLGGGSAVKAGSGG